MRSAGLQAGIATWWGQGTPTDARMNTLLAAAGTFRWSVYYEPEGTSDPTSAQIDADVGYIVTNYGNQPGFLRVNGKPVIFVYADGADGCAMADRWRIGNAGRAYLVLKVFAGYRTCASQPNSWHQYSPAVAEDRQASFSYAISPGFWKRNEASPRLSRDLTRWAGDVANMKASGERWQLVTTFNEWGEGSSVESAAEFGTAYLDVLAGGTPPPTPAPAPNPAP